MRRSWSGLASLQLTVRLLVLLVTGVVIGQYAPALRVFAIVVPLALLALNLLAAIATTSSFRRQLPLLVFHVALLALVVLSGLSVLTSMTGTAEVAEGQWFDGRMISESAGPLHPRRPGDLRFALEQADFGFLPDGSVEWLRGSVRMSGEGGGDQVVPLSVQTPVQLQGYRIYPTPARGFAVVLSWQPNGEPGPVTGAVHFPPVPSDPYRLTTEWIPPGTRSPLWMRVRLPDGPLPTATTNWVRPPQNAVLIVRAPDGRRIELQRGGEAEVAGGHLRFDEIRWWLGLSFHYDWTIPWLLAAATLAAISLAIHFAMKYRRLDWAA